jgi:Zn-dependent peptidase ImmA (M78 family)
MAVRGDLPGDRQRFLVVQELAHLFMEFPEGADETDSARAVDRFAAAFLVPAEAARFELGLRRQAISLYELHLLKHKYGLSVQEWICRARDVGILSEIAAQRLLEPFRQHDRETTKEPGDPWPTERSTRLERMVMRALSEELIVESRASELLGMPFSQFSEQFAKEHHIHPLAEPLTERSIPGSSVPPINGS